MAVRLNPASDPLESNDTVAIHGASPWFLGLANRPSEIAIRGRRVRTLPRLHFYCMRRSTANSNDPPRRNTLQNRWHSVRAESETVHPNAWVLSEQIDLQIA